jgi:hypothetical protein
LIACLLGFLSGVILGLVLFEPNVRRAMTGAMSRAFDRFMGDFGSGVMLGLFIGGLMGVFVMGYITGTLFAH